ncbi:MAG: class I SAM-dependent methyltransferase [Rhodospirillales bacterium]|nr:class I SAM-dependent methyltransferase [Rhodospirillales bacterium]
MSRRTITMTDPLYAYLLDVSLREVDVLRRLRDATAPLPLAGMQISPEQGQFMALLVQMLGARRILEVGTFTGYSALSMALALPADARIIACDVNEEWTAVARRYWAEAGVAERIDLRLAPALETLQALVDEGQAGSFDFAFIDADKQNYQAYYEQSLILVRPGGVIAVDNVLWHGSVIDPDKHDPDTEAIRAFNAALRVDARIDLSLVPIGDGLTLARRRS